MYFEPIFGCVNFPSKFILILVIKKRMAVLVLVGVSGQFQCFACPVGIVSEETAPTGHFLAPCRKYHPFHPVGRSLP